MFGKGSSVSCSWWVLVGAVTVASASFAAVTVLPWSFADGTVVDTDGDGTADVLDGSFDGVGEELAGIQLLLDSVTLGPTYESRVFFEYRLNGVTFGPPVLARLTFTLQGPAVFGLNGNVLVSSYPSDLLEKLDDFSAGPAIPQGTALVVGYQPATVHSICVSNAVNSALASGATGVAFRFQIDPASEGLLNLALIVADDVEPETKPYLSISIPGDTNDDQLVDLLDLGAFYSCLHGPDTVSPGAFCRLLDLDCDGDVDIADFSRFQESFTGTP